MQENNNNTSNFNISPEMITNLMNNFKSNYSQEKSQNSEKEDGQSNNIDFDTLLKFSSILGSINNKDDPRANLLYSLKPYLRESRQKKIDQYVNLFKITEFTNLFKNEKGDKA
ncbi:MAG: hypothetical protein IKF38_02925 [Clostridia bacterium]|nr:hypothetical protein [Clostridia bacterium]